MKFIANYHTHTRRCGHASGEDRAYVEEAIKAGIKILGFSDHAPMPFPSGHRSWHRVPLDLADDYFASLSALKKEYAGQIDIHIGLETEYYPETYPLFKEFIKDYPLEYMILGQHYLVREEDNIYSGSPSSDEDKLRLFVDNITEAISTGDFLYIAHPDIFNYTGNEEAYHREMTRLCQKAKELDIPLEINRLGFFEHRIYPSDRFFRIAGEVGNRIVIGSDAHAPDVFQDSASIEGCYQMGLRFGLTAEESLSLPKNYQS